MLSIGDAHTHDSWASLGGKIELIWKWLKDLLLILSRRLQQPEKKWRIRWNVVKKRRFNFCACKIRFDILSLRQNCLERQAYRTFRYALHHFCLERSRLMNGAGRRKKKVYDVEPMRIWMAAAQEKSLNFLWKHQSMMKTEGGSFWDVILALKHFNDS